MSDFVNPNPGFKEESWTLYSVGVVCCLLRLAGSIKRRGIKNLQLDDYFIMFGLAWYTLLCVAFNEILIGAGSNLMTPEEEEALTPEITASRIQGSKWVFVTEHAMLGTIWSMKAAMLVLYSRLTSPVPRIRKLLNYVIIWVVCGYIGDLLSLFFICRPLNQYWAVPPNNIQCATYEYYQIVNAFFNISTDILILAIGLPPVLRVRLSIQQKAILTVVFGMGSFVIIAAILRAIYCLVPSLISMVYMNWYFREASVAVYVTNFPGIWTLLREIFPKLQRLGVRSENSKRRSVAPNSYTWQSTPTARDWKDGSRDSKAAFDFDLETIPISKSAISSEHELEEGQTRGSSTSGPDSMNQHTIMKETTFSVVHVDEKSY